MTAQEYNHVFLPQINRAEEFVELFESSIEHMSETRVDKDEVRKQFRNPRLVGGNETGDPGRT